MYCRLIALAGIAAAAAIHPTLSRAASDDAALTVCEKVFAAGIAGRVIPAVGYRVTFANRGYIETEAQYDAGLYTYDLVARDRKTGIPFASATCTVDEQGAITALSYVPLTVGAPTFAAR